jgi:ubiquitin fusion degradation protein 1
MYFNNLLVVPYKSLDNFVNLPNSILEKLSKNTNLIMPYYFEIITSYECSYYVGVKEFTSQDSTIEVPTWLAENLGEDYINIKLIKDIPKAKYIKIKPLSENFFDIPENDLVLEKALSNYCILQSELIIQVVIFDVTYEIKILEIKNEDDILVDFAQIINVDLDVEFVNNFTKKEENYPSENTNSLSFENNEVSSFDQIVTPEQIANQDVKTSEEIRQARLAYYDKILKK